MKKKPLQTWWIEVPHSLEESVRLPKIRRTQRKDMFDKKSLDAMFNELKDAYELEPEWEEIQRDAHLGIARSDGGVDLGNIDPRGIEVLTKHNPR